MTNRDKMTAIQSVRGKLYSEDIYYKLLENMGDLKTNYRDYMMSESIDCDMELERLSEADYVLLYLQCYYVKIIFVTEVWVNDMSLVN